MKKKPPTTRRRPGPVRLKLRPLVETLEPGTRAMLKAAIDIRRPAVVFVDELDQFLDECCEITPRPWVVEHWRDGRVSVTQDDGGDVIAWIEPSPNVQANARVIAAAPHLLRLARELHKLLIDDYDRDELSEEGAALEQETRELLERITLRQQRGTR